MVKKIDLSPAKWIWVPSERTLPNTFVLFRKEFRLDKKPIDCKGKILANSRYKLFLNGQRIQWGPAPSDPRYPEVDPIDLKDICKKGKNTIGVEVLYYGHGEGTWVMGKPGFIMKLNIIFKSSSKLIYTNENWKCHIDRSHPPGQYKRWYLRSLQEIFDARKHPANWKENEFKEKQKWINAVELPSEANKPSLGSDYPDYLYDSGPQNEEKMYLTNRSIPLMKEKLIYSNSIKQKAIVKWKKDPDNWFDFRVPDSFEIIQQDKYNLTKNDEWWELPELEKENLAYSLIFSFEEQMVGWPLFTIEAPEGTIIELITQEAHDLENKAWLDTHYYTWSRFICKEGINKFETFDFESLKWIQLHIRNFNEKIKIKNIGVRRRKYKWNNKTVIECANNKLNRLFQACINTIDNNAQETLVDGMGRERQQYSGDIGHELHAIRYLYGAKKFSSRYIKSFSDGQTKAGYFMDCWPAYDRIVRIPQREMGLSAWGPLLDHGLQFIFDCWNHYNETAELGIVEKTYPKLKKFVNYLLTLKKQDGLLPVKNIGVPQVWIDNYYDKQKHKKCAFNLYFISMIKNALIPIAKTLNKEKDIALFQEVFNNFYENIKKSFWSEPDNSYIINLPWLDNEDKQLFGERSLSLALLYDLFPADESQEMIDLLKVKPDNYIPSFPANAGWRYWALAQEGCMDIIFKEFKEKWSNLDSVLKNNAIQEHWEVSPDSTGQWSHAAVAPLYILFMEIAGIKPTVPGFKELKIQPKIDNMEKLDLLLHPVNGTIHFQFNKDKNFLKVNLPKNCRGEIILPDSRKHDLSPGGNVFQYK